jgi:hypothetical protein
MKHHDAASHICIFAMKVQNLGLKYFHFEHQVRNHTGDLHRKASLCFDQDVSYLVAAEIELGARRLRSFRWISASRCLPTYYLPDD